MGITQSYWRITNEEFTFLLNKDDIKDEMLDRCINLTGTLDGLLFYFNNKDTVYNLIDETDTDDKLDEVLEEKMFIYRDKQMDQSRYLDIQKEWEILHFLLNGEKIPPGPTKQLKPLSKLIMG